MTKEQLQERLTQCDKDIAALKVEKEKLEEEIGKKIKPKFGDIVEFHNFFLGSKKRVWLYNEKGILCAFNYNGTMVGTSPEHYKSTGISIFNTINLNY